MGKIEHWSTVVAVSGQDWVLREEAETEIERLRAEWCKADDGWIACAEQLRGAVEALDEAVKLARDFNRGAMTWREYDRKLAALEVAHPKGQ